MKKSLSILESDALLNIMSLLISKLPKCKTTITSRQKDGAYSFIPISSSYVFNSIRFVKSLLKGNGHTFIDYGAGFGIVVKIAEELGFDAKGIEIEKFYIENSISRYKSIKEGDLNDLNLYLDKKFDVVYYYSPFEHRDKKEIFEIRAISTLNVGGYLIAPTPGVFASYFISRSKNEKYILDKGSECSKTLYNLAKNFDKVGDCIFKRVK